VRRKIIVGNTLYLSRILFERKDMMTNSGCDIIQEIGYKAGYFYFHSNLGIRELSDIFKPCSLENW